MTNDEQVIQAAHRLAAADKAVKEANAAKVRADADVLAAARRCEEAQKQYANAKDWYLKLGTAMAKPVETKPEPVFAAEPAPKANVVTPVPVKETMLDAAMKHVPSPVPPVPSGPVPNLGKGARRVSPAESR